MHKELLAAAAIALTFAMFVPYIRSIHQGRTKPHAFSWIIWSLGTLIVFFAQSAARGGLDLRAKERRMTSPNPRLALGPAHGHWGASRDCLRTV